jgi:hypothetical protein
MRLSPDLWVYALMRRASIGGAFATVERRGDSQGGAVLVKALNRRIGEARLYAEAVGADGDSFWMQPVNSLQEADLDAYIARAVRIDPDVWVVEIDDPQGRHFIIERVEAR